MRSFVLKEYMIEVTNKKNNNGISGVKRALKSFGIATEEYVQILSSSQYILYTCIYVMRLRMTRKKCETRAKR